MEINPNLELQNVITQKHQIELSSVPGRLFTMRKADLVFQAWMTENYGSVENFITLIGSKDVSRAKQIVYAIATSFFHLLSSEDQIFIRDHVKMDDRMNPETGELVKTTMIDKVVGLISSEDDALLITRAIFKAQGIGRPNPMTDEEKKKMMMKGQKGKKNS